ncbi:MAG TPA: hypothetical protein VFG81_11705 [Anaerolineales bacterium]|jgi:hypothetical protein|nr:hypothetical protein [Anaerolineales bacterium]
MSNIYIAYFSDLNGSSSPDEDQERGEACIPNISAPERKIRLRFAIWQFVITLAVLGAMIVLHLNPLWRLLLFFMFSASTVSFFQVLDKT